MSRSAAQPYVFWNYFIAIENDVMRLSRFIEFDLDVNGSAYSIELARILMAAASEVDVLAKTFLGKSAPRRPNIKDYQAALCRLIPALPDQVVYIHRFGLELKPWESWSTGGVPSWWEAYNDVKHHRSTGFSKATLESMLLAVSAIFLLLVHYGRMNNLDRYQPCPQFFSTGMDLSIWDYAVCGGAILSLGDFSKPRGNGGS